MSEIWLIGSGEMAQEYLKVIVALKKEAVVIGRGVESARKFESETGKKVITGGLKNFLSTSSAACTHAIISTGIDSLSENAMLLIDRGVKYILVEKPAGISQNEIQQIAEFANKKNVKVCVAYNRRFYSSAIKALEIINEDGGVKSFNFEFTEWAHVIENTSYSSSVKEKMFLANSTHVVDLAFYLGGRPTQISSFTAGSLSWHPTSSVFAGAGLSEKGALFSYQANWESAGRWSLEILTNNNRLILKPLEKLQIQKKGSIAINAIELDDTLDLEFKPGLYLQVKSFMENDSSRLCGIEYQLKMMKIYYQIASYKG